MLKLLVIAILVMPLQAMSKFSNESELSLLQTGGNTNLETYNISTKSTKKFEKRVLSLSGHYTFGTSEVENNGQTQTVESARNWDAKLTYEQVLTKRVNGVVAIQYEGDEFSGFKQRENTDIGGKYKLIETDKMNSFFEAGFRYSVEKTTTRNEDNKDIFYYNKGRFYYEISHKLQSNLQYKFWLEYLPNFSESEDYLINFEPSLSVTLSDTFSLKMAYKGKYDNEPNVDGYEYMDWTYTTSLIANF